MSSTLSNVRYNVRVLLGDVDVSPPAIPGYRLDQAISNHMQEVAGELPMPLAWTTAATLVAGTDTYTTTGLEILVGALYRETAQNRLVEKVNYETFAALKSTPATATYPYILAILESDPAVAGTRSTTFSLWPTPGVAGTLQALMTAMPTPVTVDADILPLGELGLRAVEYAAAAELVVGMNQDKADRLGLDKSVARGYQAMRDRFVMWEKVRVSRQRTASYGNSSTPRH